MPAARLVRVHAVADLDVGEVGGGDVVVDDSADLVHADRVVEGIVHVGRVRAGAAAQADHAVALAGVVVGALLRRVRAAEHPHRLLGVAAGEEMVPARAVQVQPLGVPGRIGALSIRAVAVESGQGAHVERVEVQLLRLPGEGRVQGAQPGLLGLTVDAVDEVDVEDRDGRVADPGERGLDIGAPLRAYGGPGLGVDEALDTEAQPGGAALGQHCEAVHGGRGRGGLDGQRDRTQVGAHALLGDVAEAFQLGRREEGGGASAEGGRGEPHRLAVAERLAYRLGLPLKGVEVGGGQAVGRADAGEEIAEAAADLAERYVQVEGHGALVLRRPQGFQRGPVGEPAVGGLVRVGVHVVLVRAGELGGRHRGALAGSRKKWAYGTVHTDSWPRRWPV